MERINIIIADDHVLFIEGLIHLLKDEPGIHILQTANNGRDLLEILNKVKADIILMDINMPLLNGLDTVKYISQAQNSAKVIMLSTYDEDQLKEKARLNGARAYIVKNCTKNELISTILSVHAGNVVFSKRGEKKQHPPDEHDLFMKQYKLSARELEVIQCIRQNLTNQEIAEKLFLSIYTIETHRKNIMNKLGLKKTAALVRFSIENNL